MNEKTKTILRYVACGIGGVALGIGLLGGLAMCASSGNRSTAESVNTILTRQKRNALGTSEHGYNMYTFSLDSSMASLDYGHAIIKTYSVGSNYTLTLTDSTSVEIADSYNPINNTINNALANATSTTSYKFLYIEGYNSMSDDSCYWAYFSFVTKTATNQNLPFIMTNSPFTFAYHLNYWGYDFNPQSGQFILSQSESDYFVFSRSVTNWVSSYSFQDIKSYYKELGYADGYSAGYSDGESVGYSSGYAEGYETGESVGYSSGYAEGFRTGYLNTYYAFTGLTANINKIWNMAEIPWHSRYDTLVTQNNFNDFPFFDQSHLQVGIYINWAYLALFRDTVTLTPYWVYAQRYTTSQNDGYNVSINIAPASEDTIQEDGQIGFTTGAYLLQSDSLFQLSAVSEWTAPNRCRLIGFMEDTENIYTDWFDNGYLIPSGIEVDSNAYEEGYRQGQHDATNDTDIQNVFSLLTPAFTAVGGFFNLKVFGFLPLYWFFLAPLLIALITLIMRMVKH